MSLILKFRTTFLTKCLHLKKSDIVYFSRIYNHSYLITIYTWNKVLVVFLHILSSSIFLPLVVASMIIAQIHLENYQIDINKRHPENNWSNFYIIFIYIAQEICIMELTLLNINIIAFTVVIPITMILRNKNKIWWGLLAITPIIAVIMNICLKRYQFVTWGTNLLPLALTATICFVLFFMQ